MEPKDFIIHANRLINGTSPDEADLRSGVSRAYYSLFHESTLVLKSKYGDQLAESIIAKLEEWKKCHPEFEYDVQRIRSIDETYIAENKISMHSRIATTLRLIDRKLARKYSAAKAYRMDADYRLDLQVKKEDAEDKLEKIKELILGVKAL